MKSSTIVLGLLSVLHTASIGAAAPRAAERTGGQAETSVVVRAGVSIFSEADRELIREYVVALPSDNLPPGLARRGGALPPGLARQLRQKGTLPPGLAKRLTPFPVELERRLPPLAPDTRRAFIEGRAVIYNSRTNIILDIFLPF